QIPTDIAEKIGGQIDVIRPQAVSRLGQKAGDSLDSRRLGWLLRQTETFDRIRKAQIVELDFVETGARRFDRDGDVVVSNLRLERVDPGQTLTIAIYLSILAFHREVGAGIRERIVLEDDDAGDCI